MQKLPEEVITYADWQVMCTVLSCNLFVLHDNDHREPYEAIRLAEELDALTNEVFEAYFGKDYQGDSSQLPDEGLVPDHFVGRLLKIKATYYDPYVP